MSAAPTFDPRRLDMAAFAQADGRLGGEWALAAMPRLLQDALPLSVESPATGVTWSARGSRTAVIGGDPEIRLYLRVHTALQMSCQRCLQPVTVVLDLQPSLRFVRGEQQAEAVDEDSEDEDVLALTATLDLQQLTEDELILALPLVPRHEHCPEPLPMSAGESDIAAADDAEHTFASLASLLREGGGKPS
jgi:uncharacterized protein